MAEKIIDTSPIAEVTGLATTPEEPFFDQFQEMVSERTPESDMIAQAQSELGEELEIDDAEVAREEMRINEIVPTSERERLNRAPAQLREMLQRDHAEITKGDTKTILDLNDAAEKIKTFTEKATAEVRKKGIVQTVDEVTESFGRQWEITSRGLKDSEKALKVLEDFNAGKISKYERDYKMGRIQEDQAATQRLMEEFKAMGLGDSVLNELASSTGQVAPSQVEILKKSGKVGIGGLILGAILKRPWTGLRYGMMFGGGHAGYRMEASGIAYDLATSRDSRGKEIPTNEILLFSKVGGALAGSLEFMGTAGVAVGSGAGKRILGGKLKAGLLRIAKNPVARNRLVRFLGGTSFAVGGEVITENLQEIITQTTANIRKNPNKDPSEIFMATAEEHYKNNVAELSKTTAQGTAVISVGTRLLLGGTSKVAQKLQGRREIKNDPIIQKQEAEEGRQEMEKAADAVEKSPLLKKRPEKIKEVMGEVPVFVPGEALRDFYEEQGQDGVARLREIFGHKVAQDFETALETGGDVRLSLPEALVEVATEGDSAFRDLLLGDGRLDPEGLSQKEADELATEIDDVQKEAEKDAVTPPEVPKEEETPVPTMEQAQAERDALRAEIKADIEKMFQEGLTKNQRVSPELIQNAEELSEIVVRIYQNMASYMGMSLQEFEKKEGIVFGHNQRASAYAGAFNETFTFTGRRRLMRELKTTRATYQQKAPLAKDVGDTFIHEMGHFIHALYEANYKKEGVSEQFNKDAEALFNWLGIDPSEIEAQETDLKRRSVLQEKHRETVAEGLQKYFHTGKAPKGMEAVFRRIQGWLTALYKTLNDIFVRNNRRSLNLEVTPEIRDVFDRLLTLDDEVSFLVSNHMAIDPNQTDAFTESLRLAGIEEERIPGILEKRDAALTEFRGQIAKREIKREQKRRNKKRQARERELDKEFRGPRLRSSFCTCKR